MSTIDATAAVATPRVVDKPMRRRPKLAETWWRHVVGVIACVFALFPIWFVASAAFNRDQSVSGTSYVPLHFTLHNFGGLLHNKVKDTGSGSIVDTPFLRWIGNSIFVALVAAFFTVMISALAAYAFSRFRFKGRRFGMLALLLIQMFPGLLLVVALYLIVLNVGSIFPFLGINTFFALILVYLGGAMGVNTWLMKGFFDTIPKELDESARVDGATPNQIFWGVVLPLALPVLAVVALLSFIGTFNEFVLASAIMQTTHHFTMPVGMRGFIDQQYGARWGYFAAGSLMAALPAAALFMWLQRYIVNGLTQGAVKG
jgi:arabinogalactan oligomer/maltooligosaccharide transport system permease protein